MVVPRMLVANLSRSVHQPVPFHVIKDYITKAKVDLETDQPTAEHAAGWRARARAWLKREPKKWRAPKWHRLKSYSLGSALDHMLRISTVFFGVCYFMQDPDPAKRAADSLKWPCLSAAAVDQGSDNVALLNFLIFALLCNIDPLWDLSHCGGLVAQGRLTSPSADIGDELSMGLTD